MATASTGVGALNYVYRKIRESAVHQLSDDSVALVHKLAPTGTSKADQLRIIAESFTQSSEGTLSKIIPPENYDKYQIAISESTMVVYPKDAVLSDQIERLGECDSNIMDEENAAIISQASSKPLNDTEYYKGLEKVTKVFFLLDPDGGAHLLHRSC